MHIVDMLSKDACAEERDKDQDRHSQIKAVNHLHIGKERLVELRRESSNDETLSLIKREFIEGWPEAVVYLESELDES